MNFLTTLFKRDPIESSLIKDWSSRVPPKLAFKYKIKSAFIFVVIRFFLLLPVIPLPLVLRHLWLLGSKHEQVFSAWCISGYASYGFFLLSITYAAGDRGGRPPRRGFVRTELFPKEVKRVEADPLSFSESFKKSVNTWMLSGAFLSAAVTVLFSWEGGLLNGLIWALVGVLTFASLVCFLFLLAFLTGLSRMFGAVVWSFLSLGMFICSIFILGRLEDSINATWFFEHIPPLWFFRNDGAMDLSVVEWVIQGGVLICSFIYGKFVFFPKVLKKKFSSEVDISGRLTEESNKSKLSAKLRGDLSSKDIHWIDRLAFVVSGKMRLSYKTLVLKSNKFPDAKSIVHLFVSIIVAAYCLYGFSIKSPFYQLLLYLLAYMFLLYANALCFCVQRDGSFMNAGQYRSVGGRRSIGGLGLFPVSPREYVSNTVFQKIFRTVLVTPFVGVIVMLALGRLGCPQGDAFFIGCSLAALTGSTFILGELWVAFNQADLGAKESTLDGFIGFVSLLWGCFLWLPILWPFSLFVLLVREVDDEPVPDFSYLPLLYAVVLVLTIWRLRVLYKKKVLTLVSS